VYSRNVKRECDIREGGGGKDFGFDRGGRGRKGGAAQYPNIYNIFFSGSMTLGS